jgi:hypothetical protein
VTPRKRLKRLAAIGALCVFLALTGAASGASDTRWQLLSYQNARGEYAIARTDAVPYPRGLAVRFHGVGYTTFYCGRSVWSWLTYWNPGFHVFPFLRQDPCVVEAEARAIGEGFPIAEGFGGSASHEWRASVAIYEAMR